jgi:hypothetical protein
MARFMRGTGVWGKRKRTMKSLKEFRPRRSLLKMTEFTIGVGT